MALDDSPQTEVQLLQGIVTALGASPSDAGQTEVALLQQWVIRLGGARTGPTEVYLLKEILFLLSPATIPGPSEVYLLRQILDALGGIGGTKTEVPLLTEILTIVSGGSPIDLTPVNTVAPALDDTSITVGDTVTCGTGTWTNSPVSYAYQWLRDGVEIVGATSNSYEAAEDDSGSELSCEVTASNAAGPSLPAESNVTDPVQGNPPVNDTPPSISSGSVKEVTTVSCPGQSEGAIDTTGFDIDSSDGVKTVRINDGADVEVTIGPDVSAEDVAIAIKDAMELAFPDLWVIERLVSTLTITDAGIGDRTNTVEVGGTFLISSSHLQVFPVGATLTRVAGTWTGADSVAGVWQHDQGTGTWLDVVPSATGATYDAQAIYAGEMIRWYETATNTNGSTSVASNELGPVSGLVLWLDASQITGLSDGGSVTTWEDKSGEGNDATQATAGFRPTYQTNEINSLPIVQFDGTDDFLALTSPLPTGNSARTVFVVFSLVADANNALISWGNNSIDQGWIVRTKNNASFALQRIGNDIEGAGGLTVVDTPYLFTASEDGSNNADARIDGVSFGTSSSATNTGTNLGCIGCFDTSQQFANARIGEIRVFDVFLDSTNRAEVEALLMSKWGKA